MTHKAAARSVRSTVVISYFPSEDAIKVRCVGYRGISSANFFEIKEGGIFDVVLPFALPRRSLKVSKVRVSTQN